MPAKNSVKIYYENAFYHVYNRGVEKRQIFLDEQDHVVFLHFLKKYLIPKPKPSSEGSADPLQYLKPIAYEGLGDEIDLLVYCLMPNHFHLLLQQKKVDSMTKLLRRICTSYSIYFNKKYERVGSLFQGIYKAVNIENENYLLHLSRYIHLNPLGLEVDPSQRINLLADYRWSSYPEYLARRNTDWVKTGLILTYFRSEKNTDRNLKNIDSYERFVEGYPVEPRELIGNISLD